MHFADPAALGLLVLIPAYLWLAWPRRSRAPRDHLGFPALALLDASSGGSRTRWANLPLLLRSATLALVVIALARPQGAAEVRDQRLRGRNVMLALDISSSMKARDFEAENRLDVSKAVLRDFIGARAGDFLGLVLFASRAFTQSPLTNNRAVLLDLLDRADIGMLPDGTAIGTALAMSESQLEDFPRGSAVIVLITDGGNNTGSPDPLTAAEAARALGIRIYAIGVTGSGATGTDLYRTGRPATMEASNTLASSDERMLRRVASRSGGRFYRATDRPALTGVLREIDQLEKAELHLREVRRQREYVALLAVPALLLLAGELTLRVSWLRTLP
jgi:Ca-activated chloride channel family protein